MKQLMKARKGAIEGFMSVAMGIGIGVVTLVILVIMLDAFQTSQTTGSLAYNITGRGLTFLDKATSQFSTAGTILGVTLLLAVIGLVGFGAYRAYKK